jgi:hypothetical protein
VKQRFRRVILPDGNIAQHSAASLLPSRRRSSSFPCLTV